MQHLLTKPERRWWGGYHSTIISFRDGLKFTRSRQSLLILFSFACLLFYLFLPQNKNIFEKWLILTKLLSSLSEPSTSAISQEHTPACQLCQSSPQQGAYKHCAKCGFWVRPIFCGPCWEENWVVCPKMCLLYHVQGILRQAESFCVI